MTIYGCDPGAHGALVSRDAARWWVWSPVAAGYRVTAAYGTFAAAHLGALGYSIGLPQGGTLVLEGTYGASPSAHVLAERRGELLGGLRLASPGLRVLAPLYTTWAPAVGCGGRKAGHERAVMARARRCMPAGLTRAEQLAWAEAWLMAKYGASL